MTLDMHRSFFEKESAMENSFASVRMDEHNPRWALAVARNGDLYRRNGDFRTEFGRDYTRIIHSTAYSRLKHKTQVFLRRKMIIFVHVSSMSIMSIP